jgi:hypothetical protein
MRRVRQPLRSVCPRDLLGFGRSHPTVKTPVPVPAEPTEAEIQHQAYLLWLEGGRRPGRELDDWLAARELLLHRRGRAADPKPARGPKKTATGAKQPPINSAQP